RARHPQDPPGLHDRPAHHRRFMSAHPKGRHRRTGRPGRLSQPRHIPARHQALALVDATAIVTTKTPIRLIQNNFVSPNPEVGLAAWSDLRRRGECARETLARPSQHVDQSTALTKARKCRFLRNRKGCVVRPSFRGTIMTGDVENLTVRVQRTRRNVLKMGVILAPAALVRTKTARAAPACAVRCNCFLKGTKIQTAEGKRKVEDL